MLKKNDLFAAPDLNADKSLLNESANNDRRADNDGRGKPQGTPVAGVPGELSEELRRKLTDKLLSNPSAVTVKNVVVDSSKERVIARFLAPGKNLSCDIEIPLDITANDLVVGLNEAYQLGIDVSDIRQCYLSCENPVALLKGKRLLGEFGIRDGSLITYYR